MVFSASDLVSGLDRAAGLPSKDAEFNGAP